MYHAFIQDYFLYEFSGKTCYHGTVSAKCKYTIKREGKGGQETDEQKKGKIFCQCSNGCYYVHYAFSCIYHSRKRGRKTEDLVGCQMTGWWLRSGTIRGRSTIDPSTHELIYCQACHVLTNGGVGDLYMGYGYLPTRS